MPKTPLSPAQRTLRAQIAANTRWGKEPDRLAATATGRRAAFEQLIKLADPDGTLPEPQRLTLAKNLERAHLQRISLRASRATQAKKARP
jgi:hypothetical protein